MEKNKKQYITSESVTEGHVDKVCDLISDSILDACLEQDQNAKVAVETLISNGKVVVAGQITTTAMIDIERMVRKKLKEVGYDDARYNMDYQTCEIAINITKQSKDIAIGVNVGGAGDQGIMFGYACNETDHFMPYAIQTAHQLAQRLTYVRKQRIIEGLKSDGKVQVTVEYINDIPTRIDTILISTQHTEDMKMDQLKEDIIAHVVKPIVDKNRIDEKTKIFINPTGKFTIGGALGDTGLTGRKIIVDTYGGYARHGGGAFSGKDGTKVDRSASYMMRHIAKNIVANGFAKKCEIQVSYGIGMEEPLSIYVDCFGTNTIPECDILEKIKNKFDLTPSGIISYLDLKRPIYHQTTNYGHFGRDGFSWEEIIPL